MQYKSFTIVVCTYNRAVLLNKTLALLSKVKYPKQKFEILVIDNNSTDDTKNVIDKWSKKTSGSIKYLLESKQGISFASNLALKKTSSDFLVFIDDDEQVNSSLLVKYNRSWSTYDNKLLAIIGGKIVPFFENEETEELFYRFSSSIDEWVFGLLDFGDSPQSLIYPNSVLAGNYSMKPELIKKLGGFDENLGISTKIGYIHADDIELCCRVLKNGYHIVYDPSIVVKNYVSRSRFFFRYLLKRYWMSGVEQWYLDKKLHGKLYTIRTSKAYIKDLFKLLLSILLLRFKYLNIYKIARSLSYIIQTIPAIRKQLFVSYQNNLPLET